MIYHNIIRHTIDYTIIQYRHPLPNTSATLRERKRPPVQVSADPRKI